MVNSLGFSLEKVAAMQEHGIRGDFLPGSSCTSPNEGVISLLHRYLGAWNFKMSRAEVPMTV